jgi:hypothetical protein
MSPRGILIPARLRARAGRHPDPRSGPGERPAGRSDRTGRVPQGWEKKVERYKPWLPTPISPRDTDSRATERTRRAARWKSRAGIPQGAGNRR